MRQSRSRHVVFDLDGTLVDSAQLISEILNAMLEERGARPRLTAAATRPHVARGGGAMVAALLGDHCGDPETEIADFRRRYLSLPTPESSLYPNARPALRALRDRDVGLSVCSNKPQRLCEKLLDDLGLAPFFSSIVGSNPSEPLKPHPALYDRALRRAGATREESCVVGDTAVDYRLARAVGAPFILMTHGYAEPDIDFDGAMRADSFSSLPSLVMEALKPGRRGAGAAARAM